MSDGYANLTLRLGEKILKDADIPFYQVLQVDLNVEWDRGYGPMTPAWSQYPVRVNYTRDGEHFLHIKNYEYMSTIIQELEDIEDEIRFG